MRFCFSLVILAALSGCAAQNASPGGASAASTNLLEARRGFKTTLLAQTGEKQAVEAAPPAVFRTVKYTAAVGDLAAYVSPDPKDGKKHSAIVWITGGDCNSIGDVWTPASPRNDQTAAAYRQNGIVMMFPSLRGGNQNPGNKEGFLGEVDDVLAATRWLEKQPYVDPKRIYLGGHSTGGTLALLVAEASPRFRATFAFGPVSDVSGYGAASGFLPFDLSNQNEVKMRSPGYFLESVTAPTWVIEGDSTTGTSNIRSLRELQKATANPNLHFVGVNGFDHFGVLAPTNALLARKISGDSGATTNITFSEADAKTLSENRSQ